MPALKELTLRQIVALDERSLSFLFEVAREEVVIIPLRQQHADGIVVLVRGVLFVKLLIEEVHRHALGKDVASGSPLRLVPAFEGGVVLGARLHFLVAFFEIVLVDGGVLVGLRKVDDDFALKAFKDARELIRSHKGGDMILIGVRRDDVFEHAVRAVLGNGGDERLRRALARTRVDEHFGIADLDERAVARVLVAEL